MKNLLHQCFWTAISVSSQTVNATEMRKVHFYFSCWHDMRAKTHSSWNQIQESYTSTELGVQTSLRHIWHIFPGTLPTCQLRRSSNKCKFLCPQGREDAGIHPRLLRVKAGSYPGRVDSYRRATKRQTTICHAFTPSSGTLLKRKMKLCTDQIEWTHMSIHTLNNDKAEGAMRVATVTRAK